MQNLYFGQSSYHAWQQHQPAHQGLRSNFRDHILVKLSKTIHQSTWIIRSIILWKRYWFNLVITYLLLNTRFHQWNIWYILGTDSQIFHLAFCFHAIWTPYCCSCSAMASIVLLELATDFEVSLTIRLRIQASSQSTNSVGYHGFTD